jgi:hypothetical protein
MSTAGPQDVVAHTDPVNGMKVNTPSVVAFTNATIYLSPDDVIESGTLVIRNGKWKTLVQCIRACGCQVMDMSETIYRLIDHHDVDASR